MQELREQLISGAGMMNLSVSEMQAESMIEYLFLLEKWNRTYNLTAVREPELMVSRHLLDSLSILSFVPENGAILDAGSGAGLPGIPLAIMRQHANFLLLDSNGKKTRFLSHVAHALNLRNVGVEQQRAESYTPAKKFDVIISRALSTLAEFVTVTRSLLSGSGKWLAMKGAYPGDEMDALKALHPDIVVTSIKPLHVPGCEGERHLVIMECANEQSVE